MRGVIRSAAAVTVVASECWLMSLAGVVSWREKGVCRQSSCVSCLFAVVIVDAAAGASQASCGKNGRGETRECERLMERGYADKRMGFK